MGSGVVSRGGQRSSKVWKTHTLILFLKKTEEGMVW